jgi:hypothetical protein
MGRRIWGATACGSDPQCKYNLLLSKMKEVFIKN